MIFKVFGTLFTFKVFLQGPCNFNLACSFSAHLPKFNPATPKLKQLGEVLQGFQSKIIIVKSVPNTSNNMQLQGFKNKQNRTYSNNIYITQHKRVEPSLNSIGFEKKWLHLLKKMSRELTLTSSYTLEFFQQQSVAAKR